MDRSQTFADFRRFFVDQLGEQVGSMVADLGRPGFRLADAATGEQTGHCRLGGSALLEPETAWPVVEGHPLSLLAILDVDALAYWLGDSWPKGIGVLNFFRLDCDRDGSDSRVRDIASTLGIHDVRLGAVIPADKSRAVETKTPDGATKFTARGQRAMPGIALPERGNLGSAWRHAIPDFDLLNHIMDTVEDWHACPGLLPAPGDPDSPDYDNDDDIAFGWPEPFGGFDPMYPAGEEPGDFHHLLQLTGRHGWYIGGEGGYLNFSIRTSHLRSGDLTAAIPTPAYWLPSRHQASAVNRSSSAPPAATRPPRRRTP